MSGVKNVVFVNRLMMMKGEGAEESKGKDFS
jgi:hypothetical protein